MLTPDEKIDPGVVVVEGRTIARIVTTAPAGVPVVDTAASILPGLIDLHGHPEFNVFAAWEPPKLYVNRYAWRGSDEYKAVLRDPWTRLTTRLADSLIRELTRYAEVRALVGGVTAIQGASAKYPDPQSRSCGTWTCRIFGEDMARSAVDLGRLAPDDASTAARADRRRHDPRVLRPPRRGPARQRALARRSWTRSRRPNLVTKATVVIHGTALTDGQLGDLRDARREARLVAPVEPAPLRRDDARGHGHRARAPARPRRRLAPERQHVASSRR